MKAFLHGACRRHTSVITMATASRNGAPLGKLQFDPSNYPATRLDETKFEERFGQKVPDPYSWLEDPDSQETKDFVTAQNEVFKGLKDKCSSLPQFQKLYTDLYNYEKMGAPSRIGNCHANHRYVVSHNSGLQSQYVLYLQESMDATAPRRVLLDPNTLSSDGTVALGRTAFSDDGSLMAYSLSKAGSDWQEIFLMRLLPKGSPEGSPVAEKLEDHLTYVKFSSLAWTLDNKGFFYNRYPPVGTADLGTEMTAAENQQLYYHRIGADQSEDVLLWTWPEHPQRFTGAGVTDDGRYLVVTASEGCEPKNMLFLLDLEQIPRHADSGALDFSAYAFENGKKLPLVPIVDEFLAEFDVVANEGSKFYLQTNLNAPLYKLVTFDFHGPGATYGPGCFAEVIAEHPKNVLTVCSALRGDTLLTGYLEDAKDVLQVRRLSTGEVLAPVDLGSCVSISTLKARREDDDAFIGVSSFADPGSTFYADLSDPSQPKLTLWRRPQLKVDADLDALITEQCFVTSKDGTKVPMFITRRKDLTLDGSAPAMLYGYGGFSISLKPSFKISALSWILGYNGIYVSTNLRGGGEYGTSWRDAGSVLNKQNVFDDFQACAQYLADHKYSSPARIVCEGGSNGGLLVAASCLQRPDLFACGLAHVGVMDMLKFHKWTIGHAWQTDYGSSERSQEEFEYLLKYSPVHNATLPEGTTKNLPSLLITTGDHDDRVVPAHSHKLAAALQHAARDAGSGQTNPLVMRIEVKAGHGAGKPTQKIIEETSECYAFAAEVVGAKWKFRG